MIHFDNVSKRYASGGDVLGNINFTLPVGAFGFLTGRSGAGKSTLLKLIAAIEFSTRGQVLIKGHNLNRLGRYKISHLRREMGIVFQNHQLLFDRTVYENVALPMVIAGFHRQDIPRRVRAALDKVGLLHKEKANPISLSGGEQQRVGIARAVVNRPALLLADEPTGNLDPALSIEIMSLFRQFNQVGVTVLIASHDLTLIEAIDAPRLTLENGKLIEDGFRGS